MSSSTPPESEDPYPAEAEWQRRFDAPLTVTPRQVQPRSPLNTVAIVAAAIGIIVVVASLIFWLTRPSQDDAQQPTPNHPTTGSAPVTTTTTTTSAEDDERLLRQLPKGYPSGVCEVAPTPEGVLSQLNCAKNADPDGPESATFTLVADRVSLEKVFNDTIAASSRVDCPGKIQSPGPWRRNATPDRVSGQLYCGFLNGQPTVVWTDEEKKTVSAVRAGPTGPTFPQLYAWWSSHS